MSANELNKLDFSYAIQGGEVYDPNSGLTWARCSVGQHWQNDGCVGEVLEFTFEEAMQQGDCEWRLPTRDELETLIDFERAERGQIPATDVAAFPGMNPDKLNYWTSTTQTNFVGWLVNFRTGRNYSNSLSASYAVRLIRDVGGRAAEDLVPVSRYVIHGGEVFDQTTALTWQRCSVGQRWEEGVGCVGEVQQLTFDEAMQHACGEWRVPTDAEFATLLIQERVDAGQFPPIDETAFPGMEQKTGAYWTSTLFSSDTAVALLAYGRFNCLYIDERISVRLVRG